MAKGGHTPSNIYITVVSLLHATMLHAMLGRLSIWKRFPHNKLRNIVALWCPVSLYYFTSEKDAHL